MSHAKNRLRTLGLGFIAVLGLTAFIASSAQAQSWLVNGQTLTGHANVDAKFHEKGKFKVPTLAGGFETECHKVALTEGLLLGSSLPEPGTAHATIHFTECLTFTEGVARPACNPVNGLVQAKTLVLPILHGGVTKLLFEPTPGEEAFTTINMPGSCALPLKNKVTGSLVAECLDTSLALLDCLHATALPLLRQVSHALGLAIGDTLKYGNHAASLGGVVDIFLLAPNAGQTLAVHGP